jgi:hypothetical protein
MLQLSQTYQGPIPEIEKENKPFLEKGSLEKLS